ncbi:MAG: mevalonate kinase [Anaerolineae bacterium]|nr:mevalonate kinase [Anaerolineae bacterium]
MTVASAPGKVILFGEHAVVYGQPAIAIPVREVQAQVRIEPGPAEQGTLVVVQDLRRRFLLREAADDDPLARIVRLALRSVRHEGDPDLTLTITSTIPIARGMGSGAAVSTAIVRALAKHFEFWLPSRAVSELVYQTEVLYHGTPSGIDNTVVAFEKPVFFVKGEGWEFFWVDKPFLLAIADTGIESSTKQVVADLRRRYEADVDRYQVLFGHVGEIASRARLAIEQGDHAALGGLMDENQELLQEMGVSCPELDRMVLAAREGGALGAKLSGAGRGGNMIALVTEEAQGRVDMMLRLAGATRVIISRVR